MFINNIFEAVDSCDDNSVSDEPADAVIIQAATYSGVNVPEANKQQVNTLT